MIWIALCFITIEGSIVGTYIILKRLNKNGKPDKSFEIMNEIKSNNSKFNIDIHKLEKSFENSGQKLNVNMKNYI